MINNKNIYNLILICLLSLCATLSQAQQSRVDSVVQLFNKSKVNNKLDSVAFSDAMDLLSKTSLNAKQIEQLKASAKQLNLWENRGWSVSIEYGIFNQIMKQDLEEAINLSLIHI